MLGAFSKITSPHIFRCLSTMEAFPSYFGVDDWALIEYINGVYKLPLPTRDDVDLVIMRQVDALSNHVPSSTAYSGSPVRVTYGGVVF